MVSGAMYRIAARLRRVLSMKASSSLGFSIELKITYWVAPWMLLQSQALILEFLNSFGKKASVLSVKEPLNMITWLRAFILRKKLWGLWIISASASSMIVKVLAFSALFSSRL